MPDISGLSDILARFQQDTPLQEAPATSPPAAAAAPDWASILSSAMQVKPDLAPETPEPAMWSKILGAVFGGIGDSASAYAGALGGFPADTQSLERMLERLRQNREVRASNRQKVAQANQESTQKMAEYQIRQMEKEAEHKQRVADAISEDEQNARLRRELQKDAEDARAKSESARQDFEKTMQKERRAFTAGQNKLDREATQTKTETANKPKTNKQAHASDEDVNAARLTAAQLADSIEAGQEKRSPEMIRKSFMRKVSAVVPSERMPDVEAYYAEHVDSLFKKPDAAAAAGPTGPSRFDLIQKALSLGAGQFARTWDDKDLEAFIAKASGTPSARPR